MQSPVIDTRRLNFSFGPRQVLFDLSLQVPSESIYCLLGPNGAGKTTFIRTMLGLLKIQKPDVFLFGLNIQSNRIAIAKRIGSLIEQPSLYAHLTGFQNLDILRLAYGCSMDRIREVLDITGISHAKDQLIKTYSQGMKQRLGIAIALLHDPVLLILDEPTNGLDPHGIIEMRELLIRLHRDFKKTIFLSSHLLSEVEKIATHFGIIKKGRLIYQGNEADLRKRATSGLFELEVDHPDAALASLAGSYSAQTKTESTIQISGLTRDTCARVIELLISNKVSIYRAGFVQNSLEDLFIEITAP